MIKTMVITVGLVLGTLNFCNAEETKTLLNPFTGRPDYVTRLSTSSIKAGSGVTVTTTSGGVEISATGSGGGFDIYPSTGENASFPYGVFASSMTFEVNDSNGGPSVVFSNPALPTGLGYFGLADIFGAFGINYGKFRFRTWSTPTNPAGFIWGDGSGSEGMKFDPSTSRLYVNVSSGAASLNVGGEVLIGSGAIGKSPDANGLRVSGTSVFESSITVQGQAVCLEDGTNCPSSSGGISGSTTSITLVFDGAGSAISSGVDASTTCATIPFAATISSWTAIVPPPSASGSISVSIRKASFTNFPTFTEMSSGGNPPSLSSSNKNAAAVASWSSALISQGDVVCGEVTSATTVQRAVISLWAVRD